MRDMTYFRTNFFGIVILPILIIAIAAVFLWTIMTAGMAIQLSKEKALYNRPAMFWRDRYPHKARRQA